MTTALSETELTKRNRLLAEVRRRGRVGRLALSRQLRISNSRVCELAQQMLEEGLLREDSERRERRGRRGVPLELNPGYGHLVGFDMEALRMRLVVVDFAGNVVWQDWQRLVPTQSRQELTEQILGFLEDRLARHIRPRFPQLMGLGLAASGVIDPHRGMILHYDLIEAARDLPLRDLIGSRFGLPCVMEDNIRAMTLAEWNEGAALDLTNFVCLAVRSGIGAGVVLDGKLHQGAHGFAGEVGYMASPAGGGSSWKHLQQRASEHALGVDVEAGAEGLSQAKANRAGELLGAQLASIAAVVDPEAFVLAGGLLEPDGPLWNPVMRTFRRIALPELAERVQILPAQLGPFGAALGATHRCFRERFPQEPLTGGSP